MYIGKGGDRYCSAQPRQNGATQLDPQHCWMFTFSRTSSRLRAVNPTTLLKPDEAEHYVTLVWSK